MMSNKNSGFASLFIVLAIVVLLGLGVGGYYVLQKKTVAPITPPAAIELPAPAQASNSNLKTYTDSQYGFSFQYPSDFILFSELTQADQSQYGSYLPVCNSQDTNEQTCLYYNYNRRDRTNGFQAAALRMLVNTATTYEDCTRMITRTKQVAIGGMTFYHDVIGDAGLGNRLNTDQYRTYYNGACYQIELSIAWNVEPSGDLSQNFKQSTLDKLQSVFSTFHFTTKETNATKHSAVVTSNWKTLTGKNMPITFQYPGALDVGDNSSDSISLQWRQNVGNSIQEISAINVMILTWPRFSNAEQAAQNEKSQDSLTTGYTKVTLGGETAYRMITTGNEIQWSIFFVAHKGVVYRISIENALPSQIDTFMRTFAFTS